MPSISKAKLDELEASVRAAEGYAKRANDRATEAETKLKAFDAVLDKVERAAQGRPLTDDRNQGGWMHSYGISSEEWQRPKPPLEERQEQEIRALNERIVGLESRLAAVVAVAQFAKEHKA